MLHLSVPGRLELLGKHTDYAGGRTLVCALERGIRAVVEPLDEPIMRIHDEEMSADCEFRISTDVAGISGHWTDYARTAARRVARNFPGPIRGATIRTWSDLPRAAGMSSSSAFMIAVFLALDAVNELHATSQYTSNIRSPLDLAGYLASIENGQSFGTLAGDAGVGTFGGSEDHTAILCGCAGKLSQYSFCPARHERDIDLPERFAFAIASSGVAAPKTGVAKDKYNQLSQSATSILRIWNDHTRRQDLSLATAVRSAPDAVDRLKHLLAAEPLLLARLDQFVEESEVLVPAAGDALLAHDLSRLGHVTERSQGLAEQLLANQVPETIALVREARELGAAAASAFGAGFGGSVWALIEKASADRFLSQWSGRYLRAFPQRRCDAQFFTSGAAPGATIW